MDQDFIRFIKRAYERFDFRKRIGNDPVEFPHRYREKRDIEVSGFIASLFSYGRVSLFKPVVERILKAMGDSPYDFLLNFIPERHNRLFHGLYYRFQKEEDILELMRILSCVLRESGSLEKAFSRFYTPGDRDTGRAIEGFSSYILSLSRYKYNGLKQLFPLPSSGSACKRMNLFLRWMVRKDEVDLGIWKDIPKNRLIIPLDVHISRLALKYGLTKRRTPDWKMAVEITESLKRLDPEDPLKYDFVLCHTGMMESNK